MKPLSVVVTIEAPASVVWEVLTDLEGTAQVLRGVTAVERLSEDTGYQVGTRWRETRTMFGQEASEEMTVTEVEPQRRTVLSAESHGMQYTSGFELRPVRDELGEPGGQTQLVMRFEGEPVEHGLMQRVLTAATGPLGAAASRRAMRQDLRDIAAEAERRAAERDR